MTAAWPLVKMVRKVRWPSTSTTHASAGGDASGRTPSRTRRRGSTTPPRGSARVGDGRRVEGGRPTPTPPTSSARGGFRPAAPSRWARGGVARGRAAERAGAGAPAAGSALGLGDGGSGAGSGTFLGLRPDVVPELRVRIHELVEFLLRHDHQLGGGGRPHVMAVALAEQERHLAEKISRAEPREGRTVLGEDVDATGDDDVQAP